MVQVRPAVAADLQDPAIGDPLSVTIDPLGSEGLGGLALLAAAEDGTSVQLLVMGAAAGTSAVVHAGDCATIDPAPLGLLGDVSSGQVQVTLPLPLSSLADGGHVIVLHPGLDLATALGCGSIPPAGRPAPVVSAEPGPVVSAAPAPVAEAASPVLAGGSYSGPTFGFSVAWDGTWTQSPIEPVAGTDRVVLTSASATLIVGAVKAFAGDATECLRSWEQNMLDLALQDRIGELVTLSVASEPAVAAGLAGPTGAYQFTQQGQDGSSTARIAHYECRPLAPGAILEIILEADAAAFPDALVRSQPVIAGIVMPAGPAVPPQAAPSQVASGVPAPVASTPVASGTSHRNANGSFSLTWATPWERIPLEDPEILVLTNGVSGVSLVALPGIDPDACMADWRSTQIDAPAASGEYVSVRVLEPEVRESSASGTTQPPAAISMSYAYQDTTTEGQRTFVSWTQCRTTSDGSLAIYHRTAEGGYAAEALARQTLLTGLAIPADAGLSSVAPALAPPEPVPSSGVADDAAARGATTPPSVPDAAPSPATAAVDPACIGVAEWADATVARLDRIEELQVEAREVAAHELIGFVASFAGQMAGMAARQEVGPVPEAAAGANARAVEAFGVLELSADLQYEGMGGGGSPDSGALSEGRRRFDEGMDIANEVRKEAERLRAQCTPEG
jgi:hypothetical protein